MKTYEIVVRMELVVEACSEEHLMDRLDIIALNLKREAMNQNVEINDWEEQDINEQ